MQKSYGFSKILIVLFALLFLSQNKNINAQDAEELKINAFVFWHGTKSVMTIQEFASYCAPVFWFSSDEPVLKKTKGKEITIPQNFPFQENNGNPVVYYQIRKILSKRTRLHSAFVKDKKNFKNSTIDLRHTKGVEIDYNHYYEFEAGLGNHPHDTEQSQFKIYVKHQINDTTREYYLILLQVTAKAHALSWYDNIYNLDTTALETELPFHILVEEGKHASCTDMNADGYYTPGYDVNLRTNDAWGLRDVIRTGELFTAEFQGYMAKVRKPAYKVLPPLPEDSPHRWKFMRDSIYAPDNAVYELRPMPNPKSAYPDKTLMNDMKSYYFENWPRVDEGTDARKLFEWWETDQFIKSISIAARFNKDIGMSISFPLLVVKNVETPLIGGWMVNRIYLQDKKLRDFGYNILFTPSASRFMDPYFAAGIEVDKYDVEGTDEIKTRTDFVMETGLKFRANVRFSPLKFLSFLTDFWGVRIGIKNKGFWTINEFSYVFEIGAGAW